MEVGVVPGDEPVLGDLAPQVWVRCEVNAIDEEGGRDLLADEDVEDEVAIPRAPAVVKRAITLFTLEP